MYPKGYRGFESLSLRHAVWVAEKLGYVDLKIAENSRNSSDVALKPDWRKCPALPPVKLSRLFLWRAHWQSRFNDSIRRMQCDYKSMGRRKRLDLLAFEASAAKTNVGNDVVSTTMLCARSPTDPTLPLRVIAKTYPRLCRGGKGHSLMQSLFRHGQQRLRLAD
jgi:hypothetical protein